MSNKRNCVVQGGKTVVFTSFANHGLMERQTPVLFEPKELSTSGLSLREKLLTIKQGYSSIITLEVSNNANYDVKLSRKSLLGRLEQMQSLTLLDVTLKDRFSERDTTNYNCSVNCLYEGQIP